MAHFAQLDINNKVIRVVVVGNDIQTSNGPLGENDMHPDGEIWCTNFYGGNNWKQTSINKKFRRNFAGTECYYLSELDIFTTPKPFESWILNKITGEWDPPISKPTIKKGILDGIEYNYRGWWDEQTQSFKAHLGQNNIYEWNTETLNWDLITVQLV